MADIFKIINIIASIRNVPQFLFKDGVHPWNAIEVRNEVTKFKSKNPDVKEIDFIKLDVDGYEYKVIQGGINSIKKFKPIMIIEFSNYTLVECGDSLESLADLLASLGYSFYSEKDSQQYDSKETLLNTVPPGSGINVLCKPKSSSESDNVYAY